MLMACATRATGPRRSAFGVLAEGQFPRLYTIARRIIRDDAEDAVQDTLLKAYRASTGSNTQAPARRGLRGSWSTCAATAGVQERGLPRKSGSDAVDEFSLYRRIADEDPFPYSDSLHLDFLAQFGGEDVRQVLGRLPDLYRVPMLSCTSMALPRRRSPR